MYERPTERTNERTNGWMDGANKTFRNFPTDLHTILNAENGLGICLLLLRDKFERRFSLYLFSLYICHALHLFGQRIQLFTIDYFVTLHYLCRVNGHLHALVC